MLKIFKIVIDHFKDGTLFSGLVSRIRKNRTRAKLSSPPPVGDIYHGDIAEHYLEHRTSKSYWKLEQDVVKTILSEISSCNSVLDVPFGTGRFVPFYLELGLDVFGLDSSDDMINVAKKQLGPDFAKCDIHIGSADRLPYSNNQIDVSVCFRFLSHVVPYDTAKTVLRELNRVSKKYAILQFRVRNPDRDPVLKLAGSDAMHDKLTEKQLVDLLTEVGFKIRDIVRLEARDTYFRAVYFCEKTGFEGS